MAEVAALREENARLQSEVAALRERLSAYEDPRPLLPAAVAGALEELHCEHHPLQSSSDWVALWWVLTTMAGAPQAFSAFAEWVGALPIGCDLPPCKASLLYKADPIFQLPIYRWEEAKGMQRPNLWRKIRMARCLKNLLTR